MSRGKGFRPPQGGGNAMAAQLQKMQAEMVKTQEALAHERVTVTAGGGLVTMSAQRETMTS